MKTQHFITLILAFVVSFSAIAQGNDDENGDGDKYGTIEDQGGGDTKAPREERNYGVGLTPIINGSSIGQGSSKTTALKFGILATGTVNLRSKLYLTLGLGFLSDSYKYSFGLSDFKAVRNSLLVDVGVFATLYTANICDDRPIDFAFGLRGIFLSGSEKTPNDFGPDFETEVNSFLFAPALRTEWFMTKHISFHTQVGIVFSLLSESINNVSSNDINIKIFQTDNLLGQAGFTFYF